MRFVVLSALLLTGCASTPIWHSMTPEERAARDAQQQQEAQESARRYVAGLRAQCVAYGFPEAQIPDCVMRLHQMNVQNGIAVGQAGAANNAALFNYSQQLMQMGQPRTLTPAAPGTTCLPLAGGGFRCQ